MTNTENFLLPVIERLALKGGSCESIQYYVQLMRNNLEELISPFGVKLADKKARLSSREIEICNMVKRGLTSKEIAILLNASYRTIEKHRTNIRKKLNITNKGFNLASFLKTL